VSTARQCIIVVRSTLPPGDNDDDALLRARALSVPTRVTVFDLLRSADGPMTAPELAAVVGVHHTAVRQHLAVLSEAGLVAAASQPHPGRGRPHRVYWAVDVVDPYEELGTALAEAMSGGLSAREIGRRRGRALVPSPDGTMATLEAEAQRLGFEPTVRRRGKGTFELVLGACPFANAAAVAPDAVCDLHLGLAEGIVERGGGLVVDALHAADPHRGGCRFSLHDG
jgi:predicted ArsR family transcriptional regulator